MNVNWTVIFQVIGFLILLYFMRKLVYSAVLETLDNRRKEISDNIVSAEQMHAEAEKLKAEYDAMISDAYEQGENIRKEITSTAHKEKDLIMESAREESGRLRDKMEKELALELAKARDELRKEAAGLAVAISSKIMEKEIDPALHDRMIKEFLRDSGDSIEK